MSAADFLSDLERRGVRLFVTDGRLRVRAPGGVLTAPLREQLQGCRNELVELLADRPAAAAVVRAATAVVPGPARARLGGVQRSDAGAPGRGPGRAGARGRAHGGGGAARGAADPADAGPGRDDRPGPRPAVARDR